jgi:hypothetical protein
MTLNLDERLDEAATEADARAIGDLSFSAPYRKYAGLVETRLYRGSRKCAFEEDQCPPGPPERHNRTSGRWRA